MFPAHLHSSLVCLRVLVVFLLTVSLVTAAEKNTEAVRAELEALAKSTTHFPLSCVIYNRELGLRHIIPDEELKQIESRADRLPLLLRDLNKDRTTLAALLEHDEPKVRTLALGALFLREDGRDLPLIATLIDDHAPTFPELYDPSFNGPRTLADHVRPLTVHAVAQAMLQFWGAPGKSMAEFKRHWQKYEGRTRSASWFRVKMNRADRRTSPLQPEYRNDIQRLLSEMEALPPPDRGWIRLYVLCSGDLMERPVTDAYLLTAARELGPDALLRFLKGEKISDDPDLLADAKGGDNLAGMKRFILLNADKLLRAQDFATLQTSVRTDRTHEEGSPAPIIGAALLRPDKASEILRPAILEATNNYNSADGQLAGALWRIRGPEEIKFLTDWYYSAPHSRNDSWRQPLVFLQEIRAAGRKDNAELMKALIGHEKFRLADWSTLQEMLEIAAEKRAAPLVDRYEVNDIERREDGDLKGALAQWRNLLRREYGLPEDKAVPSLLKPKRILTQPKWVKELPGDAKHMTISPDGKNLAVLTNGTVTIWNAIDGTMAWQVPRVPREGVQAMSFPDDNKLTVFDRAKSGRFIHWDLNTQQSISAVILTGKPDSGLDEGAYSFDSAAQKVAVVRYQHALCFDVATGKPFWSKERSDRSRLAVLSPDGKILATQSGHGLSLWDTTSGDLIRKLDDYAGEVLALAFSRDARLLATASHADGIRLIDLSNGKTLAEYSYPLSQWGLASLTFSPDGRRLAVHGASSTIGATRIGIFRTDIREWELEIQAQHQNATGGYLKPMAFAPDGKTLYTVPGKLAAWNLSAE